MTRKSMTALLARLNNLQISVLSAEKRGSGHTLLWVTDGARRAPIVVSSTPSCHRTMNNNVATARRALATQKTNAPCAEV